MRSLERRKKGEHTNIRTYIRTGQTVYPLHNFVVRGDNNAKTLPKMFKGSNSKFASVKPNKKQMHIIPACVQFEKDPLTTVRVVNANSVS